MLSAPESKISATFSYRTQTNSASPQAMAASTTNFLDGDTHARSRWPSRSREPNEIRSVRIRIIRAKDTLNFVRFSAVMIGRRYERHPHWRTHAGQDSAFYIVCGEYFGGNDWSKPHGIQLCEGGHLEAVERPAAGSLRQALHLRRRCVAPPDDNW